MSTPLAATFRFQFNYTVDTYPHKVRHYVSVSPGSGASLYDLVMRDGTAGVDSRAAASNFWTTWQATFQSAKLQIGQAELQIKSGISWVTVDASTPTPSLSGSGTYVPAVGMIATFKDTTFKVMKVSFLEQSFGAGQHSVTLAAGSLGTPLLKYITAPTAGTPDPYNWVRSRANHYIQSFVAYTTDLNDKIRRGRHIV